MSNSSSLDHLQEALGHQFQNLELLRLAVTHPSMVIDPVTNTKHKSHNQRLEFLGDAVLGLVLSVELYRHFPDVDEGPLTKGRAQLVNQKTLAEQARKIGLGKALLLGKGEELSGGRHRASTLADAFEALLGALYLDAGFEKTRDVILKLYPEGFGSLNAIPHIDNPKGELQEFLQVNSTEPPVYKVLAMSGPDHDRLFECLVQHLGTELGRGSGRTKREAESQAALAALKTLRSQVKTSPAN